MFLKNGSDWRFWHYQAFFVSIASVKKTKCFDPMIITKYNADISISSPNLIPVSFLKEGSL